MKSNVTDLPKKMTRLQRCLNAIQSEAVRSAIEHIQEEDSAPLESLLEERGIPESIPDVDSLEKFLLGMVFGQYRGYHKGFVTSTLNNMIDFRNDLTVRLGVPEEDELSVRMGELIERLQTLLKRMDK